MSIEVQDYVPGQEVEVQDPTDPKETVDRILMDRLGEFVTRVEEAMATQDPEAFIMARGAVLDMLHSRHIREWLQDMRRLSRTRFRTYAVAEDDPVETEDGESE